jgi:hypothetical protein
LDESALIEFKKVERPLSRMKKIALFEMFANPFLLTMEMAYGSKLISVLMEFIKR